MYIAIPTLAGQAAIAAAVADPEGAPLVLSHLVVGDGNGNPVTPLETMTQLVRETASVPVASITRDGNKLTILGALDETIGGFTIREVGIEDVNGVLMFVASVPATEKINNSPSTQDVLNLGMVVIVADTANVTIQVDGITYATHDYVNSALSAYRTNITTPLRPYHIAVKSLTSAAPPVSPSPGDTYIVAADATGAWAGHTGKLTQYVGAETWVFVTCPVGHLVGDEATGRVFQRTATGWVALLPAHPGGGARLWLHFDGSTRGWSDPFDINGLTQRAIVGDAQLPFHHPTHGKSRNSVSAFTALVQQQGLSQMFFLGMM